jgi:hypothetical protein
VIYMVGKLTESVRREFTDRGWRTEGEGFARTPGLLWAWGGLAYMVVGVIQNILFFSGHLRVSTLLSLIVMPISIGLLVCFILFWVLMYQYGKRLREGERGYSPGSLEADFDDQYQRPRREGADESDRPARRRDDEYDDDRGRPRRDED